MKLATPIGLLQETGVIGEILRQLPRGVLDEAEKQRDMWSWLAKWVRKNPVEHFYEGTTAMQDAECRALEKDGFKRTGIGVYSTGRSRSNTKVYKGIQEVSFYSHYHDPNKVFIRVVMDARWPDAFRKTFEAAASQRKAFIVLGQVARDGGSISSHDWHLRLLAAEKGRERKKADHWANKHLASILQTLRGRQWLLEDNVRGLSAPRAMRKWARIKYEAFYAADRRRLGRKKADDKWKSARPLRFKMESNSDKVAEAMTTGWLTVDHTGFPGLCFMSDELLAQLLGHTLPLPSLLSNGGWKFVRTIRERIGLKKAEILFTSFEKIAENKWAILNRCGEKTHWICLRASKPLPPEL